MASVRMIPLIAYLAPKQMMRYTALVNQAGFKTWYSFSSV